MPDITMCTNKHCTLKNVCYRFKADANPFWQSYAEFEQKDDGTCDYFMELFKPVPLEDIMNEFSDEDKERINKRAKELIENLIMELDKND